jgi:hypothetical protein
MRHLSNALDDESSASNTQEPRATLKLKLKASTSYTEEATYTGVTVEQWSKVCRVLSGTDGMNSVASVGAKGVNTDGGKSNGI